MINLWLLCKSWDFIFGILCIVNKMANLRPWDFILVTLKFQNLRLWILSWAMVWNVWWFTHIRHDTWMVRQWQCHGICFVVRHCIELAQSYHPLYYAIFSGGFPKWKPKNCPKKVPKMEAQKLFQNKMVPKMEAQKLSKKKWFPKWKPKNFPKKFPKWKPQDFPQKNPKWKPKNLPKEVVPKMKAQKLSKKKWFPKWEPQNWSKKVGFPKWKPKKCSQKGSHNGIPTGKLSRWDWFFPSRNLHEAPWSPPNAPTWAQHRPHIA